MSSSRACTVPFFQIFNAQEPIVQVPLNLFGGLYTEADPTSLPEGASPLTINCDYDLGSVFQRPGKESVFVYDTFFEKLPTAVESTGTDAAPWSSGSVTLNSGGPAANPNLYTTFSFPGLSRTGNSLVWQGGGFFGHIDGPLVMIVPMYTVAAMPPFGQGDAVAATGLTDNAGGIWTQILGPISATRSEPPPYDPGTYYSYQLWVGFFANGLPGTPDLTISVAYDGDWGTAISVTNASILQFCSNIDQFNFLKFVAPGPSLGGAPITTSQDSIILSISNITNSFALPPVDTFRYQNSHTIPGIATAAYGSGGTVVIQPPGTYNPTWDFSYPAGPLPDTLLTTLSVLAATSGPGFPTSEILQSLNFTPPIPPNSAQTPAEAAACGCGCILPGDLPVFGLEVLITGSQTDLSPDAVLTVQLKLPDGSLSPTSFTIQLPLTTGTVIVGSPTETWGVTLSATLLNDPNFTVNVVASTTEGEQVTFTVAVKLRVFTTPNPPPDINYLKTYANIDGDVLNLALGSDGVMYQEDAINDPNVFSPVYSAIEPDTFAESCTVDDREFIALSNLLNGTDVPYTYDGTNFDRLSQVGPGARPTASTTTATNTIVSITQPTVKSDVDNVGHLSGILWSNGPGSTAPGNVLTVYYTRVSSQPLADPDLQPGVGVTIAGVDVPGPNQDFNGQAVDGNYTVVSIGQGVPPGAEFERWYFTVTMPSSQSVNQANHITAHAPFGTYQVTTATVTTTSQVPNAEVGSTIQIAGTGGAPPAGYDGSWTITETPNAAQLQITSTQITGNVASYGFNLISGTLPVVGQQVTVTGTLNGNGIFNVTNATISTTSPGIFSILLTAPDTPSVAETGSGIIFGTIFKFEPGQPVGTRTGGTIVTLGIISAGRRKVCYSFLTRNGYMTAPSPIFEFDVPAGASTLTIGNLASGPDNVIARVVHLTAADGGNFYNIPIPVIVLDNGIEVTNSSTYLNDNTSRSINLSFSDGVLLAATAIDVQGNNLFATLELGSSTGLIEYASRVFAIGEQNKVPNFLNWSFDGGYLEVPPAPPINPLGWTIAGAGGSLVNSPIFGFAYQISGGSGMLTQAAFQDEFKVPIIRPSTTYSVRITAMVAALVGTGNLIVDLYSPSFGTAFGTFSLPLASLATRMNIFTGTMLTTALSPVPNDLQLRLYVSSIGGASVLIDRLEPFPTEQPVLSTQVTGSYINNFEAFDESGNGGIVDTAGENQQPVKSAFTLYDTLYLVKTGSLLSTQDNASTEPVGWSIRAVSNSVGTTSIYGVTTGIDEPNTGEAWAIIAGQSGGYIFNGSEPVKITEEIQKLWNLINWRYGHTLWVKNDVKNRRVYFAVPLKTPNQWLPTGIIPDDDNPTTPNVILMLNYRQLNTGSALESRVGVHVGYSGRLLASELTRKWSIWTIKAPCAAFLRRNDTTDEFFLGNSAHNGKIFRLNDDFCGKDDCLPMTQIYTTYGFATDDQGQGLRMGSLRKVFSYMATLVDGSGDLNLRVFPNTLDSQFAHDLLPRITLPLMTDGDIEIPLNETANRLFVQYKTDEIDACFNLSRIMMAMQQDPWSPVRGRNY